MTELTGKKDQVITGPQRMTYLVADVFNRTSLGQYKSSEDVHFALLCKLSSLFEGIVPGFNEDEFMRKAGLKNRKR